MKKPLILFILLFSIKGIAQDPQLFENTWYLHNLIIDESSNPPPSNSELNFINLLFFDTPSENFITYACDNGEGDITFDDPNSSFSFTNFGIVLFGDCGFQPNIDYTELYLDFFENDISTPFTYNISPEGSGFSLIITSQSGDMALYGDQQLSLQDQNKLVIGIYPNPVKDILTIESPEPITGVSVYTIEGRKLLEITQNTNEISMATMPSGLLLVNIITQNGSLLKKVVKK